MDNRLSRYIWKHTKKQQIWILWIVAISMIPYFLSFDLPKQIVNGPIQGEGFESEGATQLFMHMDVDIPGWGNVVLFPGLELDRVGTLFGLSLFFLLLVIINGLFKFYIIPTRAGWANVFCAVSASSWSTGSCGSRRASSSASRAPKSPA